MSDRNWMRVVRERTQLKSAPPPTPFSHGLGRQFGDLEVRPKLVLLHNLFFLTLAMSVYLAVIPAFERRVQQARSVEISLLSELFSSDNKVPELAQHSYAEGTALDLAIPHDALRELDTQPGRVIRAGDVLYRKDADTGTYARLILPSTVYDEVVERTRTMLFVVLGALYIVAVLLLELVIMPRFVYGPLRLMLEADQATRAGDREREMIDSAFITQDEIGRIMHSRNQTVAKLRQHEDDLARAIAHLEAQDRLASLGLLSASVAHEMNTPLTVLQGSVERLLETTQDPNTRSRLERMARVVQRLRTISEGLLDFTRVRTDQFGPVPMRALLQEAWTLVSIDEKASSITFRNEIAVDAAALGNSDRLIQVFVNLLRNALEAISSGGNITVRCRRAERDGKGLLVITVDDDGPGIPADVLPDIFDAFVSSRLDSRGTGLGLYVAAGIVGQHGGEIHAANCPNGGARIEIYLPESRPSATLVDESEMERRA